MPPSLRKWINEMPAALMGPAAVLASVTCRAAMKPPARLAIFPASYACFRVLNSMTLYTSLILILLIWSQRLCGTPPATATARITTALALFGMLCLISTFVFASSPEDPVSGFARLLRAAVVCVLVYSVALAFGKRATRSRNAGRESCPPQMIKP